MPHAPTADLQSEPGHATPTAPQVNPSNPREREAQDANRTTNAPLALRPPHNTCENTPHRIDGPNTSHVHEPRTQAIRKRPPTAHAYTRRLAARNTRAPHPERDRTNHDHGADGETPRHTSTPQGTSSRHRRPSPHHKPAAPRAQPAAATPHHPVTHSTGSGKELNVAVQSATPNAANNPRNHNQANRPPARHPTPVERSATSPQATAPPTQNDTPRQNHSSRAKPPATTGATPKKAVTPRQQARKPRHARLNHITSQIEPPGEQTTLTRPAPRGPHPHRRSHKPPPPPRSRGPPGQPEPHGPRRPPHQHPPPAPETDRPAAQQPQGHAVAPRQRNAQEQPPAAHPDRAKQKKHPADPPATLE
ncbi:hypothetical protein SAMN05192583_0541 [Sphingomonas gellani]|uniref:Uncharacterized protein n=1 Tax=Sphingomonas gellani TaxID=1166340 RepID=A0A1H7Z7K5_9SPHN|nr:hypothetical protein SAMN05192583_0541 [Sphingomonas gellani]